MGKNEYYLKQIGARIMECRKEKGYQNREEFAKLLGISSNTLRNYENGVREKSLRQHLIMALMSMMAEMLMTTLPTRIRPAPLRQRPSHRAVARPIQPARQRPLHLRHRRAQRLPPARRRHPLLPRQHRQPHQLSHQSHPPRRWSILILLRGTS